MYKMNVGAPSKLLRIAEFKVGNLYRRKLKHVPNHPTFYVVFILCVI